MRNWLCCTCHQDGYWKVKAPPIEVPSLRLEELKEKTDNFGAQYLIGKQVSYAKVYYAYLNHGTGQKVAATIYKLNDASSKVASLCELLAKASMVSKLKHENVVELVGYCVESNVRCLAYEFPTFGSLHDILYGDQPPRPVLDWTQRMRIAVDAARGLEYLHHRVEPCIIHRDICSRNVLLFEDLRAKIADFDLLYNERAPSPRRRPQYAAVAPPEYVKTGELTQQGDVYMFGVILLELLTGRKAFDAKLPLEERKLVTWAYPRLFGMDVIQNVVDPKLREGEYPIKAVFNLVKVVALCVQSDPDRRPTMSFMVKVLETILHPAAPTTRFFTSCQLQYY